MEKVRWTKPRYLPFLPYVYLNKNSMIEEESYRRGLVKKLLPTLTIDIV
jgi:hypothetical protein